MRLLPLLALPVSCALASAAQAACRATDVEIKQADWRATPGYIAVVGEIVNRCAEPVGAQLQFTFRDAGGRVVAVEETWPASTRNVEAGASYPFSRTFFISDPVSTMTARVIDTRRW